MIKEKWKAIPGNDTIPVLKASLFRREASHTYD